MCSAKTVFLHFHTCAADNVHFASTLKRNTIAEVDSFAVGSPDPDWNQSAEDTHDVTESSSCESFVPEGDPLSRAQDCDSEEDLLGEG